MSKLVYICFRDYSDEFPKYKVEIKKLESVLNPKDFKVAPSHFFSKDGILIYITNPSPTLSIRSSSVNMGVFFECLPEWWKPLTKVPDGTYALFRGDKNWVELVTDTVSTRTIWYVFTKDLLIASTSQRAVIALLGNFKLNPNTILWMLSSGTLGPDNAWDRRIRPLTVGTRLILDRRHWELNLRREPCRFKNSKENHRLLSKKLLNVLEQTFSKIKFGSQWALPLSGGYDSRAILLFLIQSNHLKPLCITWGVRSSLSQPLNDAAIAKQLANELNVRHLFFPLDGIQEPFNSLCHKYLWYGEGRVDHVSGYMDGFYLWRSLYENGIRGIIRGDEGFGWKPVSSPTDVLIKNGIILLNHLWTDKEIFGFELEPQSLPTTMIQRKNESLASWRDRLYHTFRIPYILAALNDMKLPFVEIMNPLLSQEIISLIRQFPDDLRTDKWLFKQLVRSLSPDMAFAKKAATKSRKHLFSQPDIARFLLDALDSNSVLPKRFILYLKKGCRSIATSSIDFHTIALRCHIIQEMNTMLAEDATLNIIHV